MKTHGSLEKIEQKLCKIFQLDWCPNGLLLLCTNSFILVHYDAGNMDMTSIKWKVFVPYKNGGWLQHTVDYKVCGLARLTLYENLFIEEEKNVHYPL